METRRSVLDGSHMLKCAVKESIIEDGAVGRQDEVEPRNYTKKIVVLNDRKGGGRGVSGS